VDGNPSTGVEGSIPSAKSFEQPQRELSNLLAGTGLTGSDADLTQILQAVSKGIYLGTFTGTANALTATVPGSVAIPVLLEGMTFHGYIGASPNTAAANLTLSGFTNAPGSKPIRRKDGTSALAAGDLQAGTLMSFRYDGTSFRVVGMVASDIAVFTPINLTASLNYYVNATSGSDSNDGLTSGTAFATIQKAINQIPKFNTNGFNITIHVADGAYTAVRCPQINGAGSVFVIGNTANPANCTITGTNSSAITAAVCLNSSACLCS
jgi:hypothetical protein